MPVACVFFTWIAQSDDQFHDLFPVSSITDAGLDAKNVTLFFLRLFGAFGRSLRLQGGGAGDRGNGEVAVGDHRRDARREFDMAEM